MALSPKQVRQRVGQELGLVYSGTMTTWAGTNVIDTSDDSPMDPGDIASRFNGAGVLIHNPTGAGTIAYRQNATYTPGSQQLAITAIGSSAGSPDYEIHLEPLLHPLLIWPRLINDALARIKRLVFPHLYLTNNRGFYDLTKYPDITGPEQVRRIYKVGNNLLQNSDFREWDQAAADPDYWLSTTGNPVIASVPNYPNAATLDVTETMTQVVRTGVGSRRLRFSVWGDGTAGGTLRATLTAHFTDGTVERTVTTDTVMTTSAQETIVEIETTPQTSYVTVGVKHNSGGGTITVWTPVLYHLSRGERRRLQPFNVYNENGTQRLYIAERTDNKIAQMALLLPYPSISGAATVAADTTTIAAPDELLVAAVCVQVLRWLVNHRDIPSDSKREYALTLQTWEGMFRNRSREHMRRLSKTQQTWEAGELN